MTKLFVEDQGDRVFVWACLTDDELSALGEPSAFVSPGEMFGGISYMQFVEIAATEGVIDSDDLRID